MQWIPVEVQLPSENVRVLVFTRTKKGVPNINIAYRNNYGWHGNGSMSAVIAWMPLPEPYYKTK